MKPRTLAENVVVVAGLLGFGIIGGLVLSLFLNQWWPVQGVDDEAISAAGVRGVVFGAIGGYVMGIVAGFALKEEEE